MEGQRLKSSNPSLQVKKGDVLCSPFAQYTVQEILGRGVFGQVAKCQNMSTNNMVAVKILLHGDTLEEEVKMLRKVSSLNHPNILNFFEKFQCQGHQCMVFELLHKDLYQTIINNDLEMQLTAIRPIAKQLFSALDALSDVGILHTDIKADNIMFVGKSDLKVKLIDFGLALPDAEATPGLHMQPVPCRSPEILLGLPFSHGIDMWGCGCVLAFLYLQDHLFKVNTTYAMMRQIVQLLGQPEDHLLFAGKYTTEYFTQVEASGGPAWRLKTPEEYASGTGAEAVENIRDSEFESLGDLVDVYDCTSSDELDDRLQFIDLLMSLLNVDATKRISAFQAGNHPFVTMSHLSDPYNITYLEESVEMMRCCSEVDSADEQQCYEEILEDQQVWEWLEDRVRNLSEWEEHEPEGWGQHTHNTWKQPSKGDWEQSEDSSWEDPDSVDPDLEFEEPVYVTETTTPSLEKNQTDSAIMDEVVFGLRVMTCLPAASIETTDSSSQDSTWKNFSVRLQRSWRSFKSFLTSYY